MSEVLNIPTLLLCLGVGTAILGCFLIAAWKKDRGDNALMLWSLGYWGLASGVFLLAFSSVLPQWLYACVGNFLTLLCLVFYRAGFQVFDGKRATFAVSLTAPVLWVALYLFWPRFSQDVDVRIIVAATLLTLQCAAVSYVSWNSPGFARSSVRHAVTLMFAGVALIDFVRVVLSVWSYMVGLSTVGGNWESFFMFAIYGLAMFSGVAIFVLVRERTEEHYRVASEVDELTGILNRRAFIQYVDTVRNRSNNGGALALLDIDHFKRINDTFGHGAGDEALKSFCRTISGLVQPGMIFGRVGGEEFALYMPDFDLESAKRHCEAVRVAVEEVVIPLPAEGLKITVSQGLCADINSDTEVGFLLGLADRALYISKRGGRNRVTALNPSSGLKMIASQMAARSGPSERRAQRTMRFPL